MDAIEPAYGTAPLLIIAALAVGALLFLIIKVKLHAFISLVLISGLTAVAAGIPLSDVPDALMSGFSGTLGSVALLVGFGVMLGRLLEHTGGAQVLADVLINRFGEKRAPMALGVAALIFGFPIFFDAGLVVFLPIIFTVARRFGGSILLYGLPTAGAFAAMHATVPPHPGPVAAADLIGGDIGLTLIIGVPVAVVGWFFGAYLVGLYLGRRYNVSVPTSIFGEMNTNQAGTDGEGGTAQIVAPKFRTVLLILILPFVLISFQTVVDTLLTAGVLEEAAVWDAFILIGQTPVALLITLLIALCVLSLGRFSLEEGRDLVDKALGPICSIILITGAGGMFGGVLQASGIGESLTDSLSGMGIPLILQTFLIATALRVARS